MEDVCVRITKSTSGNTWATDEPISRDYAGKRGRYVLEVPVSPADEGWSTPNYLTVVVPTVTAN